MIRKTIIWTGLSVLTVGAVLAGCGSSDDNAMPGMQDSTGNTDPAGRQADHNQADLTFAQQMIPHHAGAVEMAKMVQGRTSNPKILNLAARVQNAQEPEIQQMTEWVNKWGAMPGVTGGAPGSMPEMSGDSMPGMDMGTDEMATLSKTTGAAFDQMWLEMMIKHHQDAITMAQTELSQGSNPNAKTLAQKIIDAQQAEITEMQGLNGHT